MASSRTVSKHSFILKFDSDFDELDNPDSNISIKVKEENKDAHINNKEGIRLNDKLPLLKKQDSRPEVKFKITNSIGKKNRLKPQHLTLNMEHVFTPSKQQLSAGRKSVIFIHNQNLDLIDLENIERIKERNSLSVIPARSPYKSNTSRVLPHLEGKANEIATIFNFNSPLNNSFHNEAANNSNQVFSEKLTEEHDNSSQVLKYRRNNTLTKSGQYTLTIFDSNEKNITDNIQSSSNKNMRGNPHKPKSSINLLASPENINNRFTSNFCLRTKKGSFNTCKEPNSFKFSPYKIIQQLNQDLNQEHIHKTENLTRQLSKIDGETDDSKIELSKNSSGNLINFNDSNNYKSFDYLNNPSFLNNLNQDSGNPLRKRSGLILKKYSLEVI